MSGRRVALGIVAVPVLGLLAGPAAGDVPPPGLALTVSPAYALLGPGAATRIRIANGGANPVAVGVAAADYVVSPRGAVVAAPRSSRSAKRWLRISPARLVLLPGTTAAVDVRTQVPRSASPGDHHALVQVTARGGAAGAVGSAAQIGVNTVVRVAGPLFRDVRVGAVRLHRAGSGPVFRLSVSNRGNVIERLPAGRVTLALRRNGRVVAVLAAAPRDLLPGTSGVIAIPDPLPVRGPVQAVAVVRPLPALLSGPRITSSLAPITRRSRVRL